MDSNTDSEDVDDDDVDDDDVDLDVDLDKDVDDAGGCDNEDRNDDSPPPASRNLATRTSYMGSAFDARFDATLARHDGHS